MKKEHPTPKTEADTKKGYNEKNPGQSQGAFSPESHEQPPQKDAKSNTADKKKKQDQE